MEWTLDEEEQFLTESVQREPATFTSVFICGFVPNRWHNSSLNGIIADLAPHYYVARNSEWQSFTRNLLANAECFLFFVNEYTLADESCLCFLQYAWIFMIPIIVLRPPRTKLVITARSRQRNHIIVNSNGTISRSLDYPSPTLSQSNEFPTPIDYGLLQDVLHEGYRIAAIYDRLDHKKSMKRILQRVKHATQSFSLADEEADIEEEIMDAFKSTSNSQATSHRSQSNGSRQRILESVSPSARKMLEKRQERLEPREYSQKTPSNMRASRSTPALLGDTSTINNGKLHSNMQKLPRTPYRKKCPDLEIKAEGDNNCESVISDKSRSTRTSISSPFDTRGSMMSLEDVSHFTNTQYLVFPIHDSSKKPQLLRFPQDLIIEDLEKQDSVWGSDSDLEQEAEIAPRIEGDLCDEDDPDSPPPAPYNDSLI